MNIDPDNLKNGRPDEALLTAYALGELNPAEQVVVEASLAGSPDGRRRVEEIRTLAADLWETARRDAPPEASGALRDAIEKRFKEQRFKEQRFKEQRFKERCETEEARAMEAKPEPPTIDAKRPYPTRRYLVVLAATACLLMAAIPSYRLFFPGGTRVADQNVAMTLPQAESPAIETADGEERETAPEYAAYSAASLPAEDPGPAERSARATTRRATALAEAARADASVSAGAKAAPRPALGREPNPASERAESDMMYVTDHAADEAGAGDVSGVATKGGGTVGMSVPRVYSADLDIPYSVESFSGDLAEARIVTSKPTPSDARPPVNSLAESATHGTSRGARPAQEGVAADSSDMSSSFYVQPPRSPSPRSSTSRTPTANRPAPISSGSGVAGSGRGLASETSRSAEIPVEVRVRVDPIDTYGYGEEMEAPEANSMDGMEEMAEEMGQMGLSQEVAPNDGLAITAPTGPAPVIRGKTTLTPMEERFSGYEVQADDPGRGRPRGAAYGSSRGGMGGRMMEGYGGMMGGMGGGESEEDAIMGSGGMGMGMGSGMGLSESGSPQPAKGQTPVSSYPGGPYLNKNPYVPHQRLAGKSKKEAAGQSLGLADVEVEVRQRLDVQVLRGRRLAEARVSIESLGTEQYEPIVENEFLVVDQKHAKSTFSVDVDTASYANVRRFLDEGRLPPPNAVRIEELVNYFQYDYPLPDGEVPFSVDVEMAQCPWTVGHRLARIGIKGQEVHVEERGPSNLVFLLDVSGSMSDANKLPLVKQAMTMLVDQLTEDDRVAIVTYAGSAGVALEPTRADKPGKIRRAIEALSSGGSTHGSAGIVMAYDSAMRHYVPKGTNRVILCTDGDLNVGITDDDELVQLITQQAKSGVFLTVFGFGTGNLKDSKMEKLADKGNGSYAYVDGLREAKRVFVEQVSGSLVTIAKDVKIQIEFNPAEVAAYRLIGYENRVMAAKDFANDKKDAGEIGAGHTVTALYEIVPADGETPDVVAADRQLKYQRSVGKKAELTKAARSGEIFTLALRYKLPDGDTSRLLEYVAKDSGHRFGEASADFRFASSVAAFGMLVRSSQYAGDLTFSAVEEFAAGATANDPGGYRSEFVDLVRRAGQLRPR